MSRGTPRAPATGDALIGIWQLLRCDSPLEIEPGTRMHFTAPDQLEYIIPAADGALRVSLRWRVESGVLHTAHEDGSNAVRVPIELRPEGILMCDFGGPRALFVQVV